MANVFWRGGRQRARAQVATLTVTTASTGGTITVTVGGVKSVVVTPTTTNTTTTATELAAALAASTEPEFQEITWTSSGAVVTGTGPADGTPFTISKTDGGSNATTLAATATAPLSPYDAADAANYAGGALPTASDTLVLQDGDVPMKFGLTALTDAFPVVRKETYTGSIGLPDTNPAGYPEYRTTHLELAGTSITVEGSSRDVPGQFRLKSTAAGAVTLTYSGGSPGQLGSEVLEVHGLPASSVLNVTGGSVAVAPKVGQTATLGAWRGTNASFRVGSGVTISAGAALQNVTASVLSSWSGTLTLNGGDVTVGGAAAGTVVLEAGRMTWRSTGNPGNSPVVGSGAELNLALAPAALTIGGTVAAYEGCRIDDSAGRGGNYALNAVHCTLADFTWLTANNKTYTLS